MTRGIFVTGTDTGVGKTVAACALIHALARDGVRATPMKPIAAGAEEHDGRWLNEDTRRLMEAAGLEPGRHAEVTPVLLKEPMAPHIAAARAGVRIELDGIVQAYRELASRSEFMVVEGVGGFAVPLGERTDTVQLARAIDLPVLLVVGMRLGCLNHALLTAQAVDAAGLRLAGWIANRIDPEMAVADENVEALRARLAAPLLGVLPHQSQPDPRAAAAFLNVSALVA